MDEQTLGGRVMAIVCDTCGAKFTDWASVPPVPEDSPFLDIDPGCPECPIGILYDEDEGANNSGDVLSPIDVH